MNYTAQVLRDGQWIPVGVWPDYVVAVHEFCADEEGILYADTSLRYIPLRRKRRAQNHERFTD